MKLHETESEMQGGIPFAKSVEKSVNANPCLYMFAFRHLASPSIFQL